MNTTLFVHIDTNPSPETTKEIICHDYNMEPYFCSHLGYVLMEGIKQEDGQPLFRSFRPGLLITELKSHNINIYTIIQNKWNQIRKELLNKMPENISDFSLRLPNEYIEWLCHNENRQFVMVGEYLKQKGIEIDLSAKELHDDIIEPFLEQLKTVITKHRMIELQRIIIGDLSVDRFSYIVSRIRGFVQRVDIIGLQEWFWISKSFICEKLFKELRIWKNPFGQDPFYKLNQQSFSFLQKRSLDNTTRNKVFVESNFRFIDGSAIVDTEKKGPIQLKKDEAWTETISIYESTLKSRLPDGC